MDAIGLLLSATMVVTVFVAFELVVRVVGDAVDDVRYSVAPAVLGGLRAWGDGDRETRSRPGALPEADDALPSSGGPAPHPPATRTRDGGHVVPVTAVTRHRSHCIAD